MFRLSEEVAVALGASLAGIKARPLGRVAIEGELEWR